MIDRNTLDYALHTLDTKLIYCKTKQDSAYYQGMRNMLEIVISEAYTKDVYITSSNTGKHYAVDQLAAETSTEDKKKKNDVV